MGEEDQLPYYAIRRFGGVYEIGTLLATRDGRRHGNGIVVSNSHTMSLTGMQGMVIPVYTVRTDFGNEMTLTINELEATFYRPIYIGSVSEWRKTMGENHMKG